MLCRELQHQLNFYLSNDPIIWFPSFERQAWHRHRLLGSKGCCWAEMGTPFHWGLSFTLVWVVKTKTYYQIEKLNFKFVAEQICRIYWLDKTYLKETLLEQMPDWQHEGATLQASPLPARRQCLQVCSGDRSSELQRARLSKAGGLAPWLESTGTFPPGDVKTRQWPRPSLPLPSLTVQFFLFSSFCLLVFLFLT